MAAELLAWLRRRPMMHVEGNYAMVHAGLLPHWTIDKARSLGEEVRARAAGAELPGIPSATCTATSPAAGTTRWQVGTGCA